MTDHSDVPLELVPRRRVAGALAVPGDKSISHRALLLAAVSEGRCTIRNLAPGADVRSTRAVCETLGITVEPRDDGALVVHGRGLSGLDRDPGDRPLELDCGNSGTTARLLLGLLAGRRGRFRLRGDASLSRRPMRRVGEPLVRFGARIAGGDTLPLEIEGAPLTAADVQAPVASAQVKSALVLAALQARGTSRIDLPRPTRDHTERMLRALGAPVRCESPAGGGERIVVDGPVAALAPFTLDVPGDPSSAAFFAALACLLPSSRIVLDNVSLNPTRFGFFDLLERMGAEIERRPADGPDGLEPRGALVAASSRLRAIEVDGDDVTAAIDEIPLLAVVATQARGRTVIRGAGELRVKESDRIRATAELLAAFGAGVRELDDGLEVEGGAVLRGAEVDAVGDHRIAMCAAVLAAIARGPSRLRGAHWVRVSWPGFFDELERLAADG